MTKSQDDNDNCEVETITLQKWQECFRDKERKLYQKALTRKLAGGYDWQDYIMYLEILPKLVLGVLSIDFEPTNDDEAKMWVILLRNWSTKAKWIDHLRDLRFNTIPITWLLLREINSLAGILFLRKSLNRQTQQPPEPLAGDPDWVNHFKPQSELSIAFLNLCIELYPRSPELQKLTPYPSEFWYLWERENCLASIQSSGLLPEIYRPRQAKENFRKEVSDEAKWLSEISSSSTDEEVFPEGRSIQICTIERRIVTLAAQIARTTRNKEGKDFCIAFENFYKAIRRNARYVREHKCFGSHEMQNGKIVEAGRKGKRVARIAGQKFQPGVGYVTSPHVTKSLRKID